MRYRVAFTLLEGPVYYTEWFDTLNEAHVFVERANYTPHVFVLYIEDSNHNVIR